MDDDDPAPTVRTELVTALHDIDAVARGNIERNEAIRRRVGYLLERMETDASLRELLESLPGPRIVELITANIEQLQVSGSRLRALQAEALREEGLTMEQIAGLFGVTRQRISALLRARTADGPDGTMEPDAALSRSRSCGPDADQGAHRARGR